MAFLIDNILLQAAATFVFIVGFSLVDSDMDIATLSSLPVLYYLIAVTMNLFYFTYFHSITGQTVGKRILGLRVVTAAGEPLKVRQAFLRWVGYLVSTVFFYLGFIWVAFDGRKQGWHDKIAGTLVVRVDLHSEEVQPDLFVKIP
jgi:uncharacterized RDD family membrane protein YckC